MSSHVFYLHRSLSFHRIFQYSVLVFFLCVCLFKLVENVFSCCVLMLLWYFPCIGVRLSSMRCAFSCLHVKQFRAILRLHACSLLIYYGEFDVVIVAGLFYVSISAGLAAVCMISLSSGTDSL